MSGNILIDTNIVIKILEGDKAVAALVKGKIVYLSAITEIELLSNHKLDNK